MAEDSTDSLYEIYDSLSPYEVAVLTFTSPRAFSTVDAPEYSVVITTKESYLWAGAVAYALVQKPLLSQKEVVLALNQAVMRYLVSRHTYRDIAMPKYGPRQVEYQNYAIEHFLELLNVPNPEFVYPRTEEAVRSLVWRGYIEDPFSKKLGAFVASLLLVFPVSFTSTGPNNVRLEALTWQYVQSAENDRESRQFRIKVKEVSEVVLNQIVPAMVGAMRTLSGSTDGQGMKERDVQLKLAQLNYYSGEIDGKMGPKTIEALRRFQRNNNLEVTSYLDPATLQRLKAA
jgi:Putative peptidoglycan binding domain